MGCRMGPVAALEGLEPWTALPRLSWEDDLGAAGLSVLMLAGTWSRCFGSRLCLLPLMV